MKFCGRNTAVLTKIKKALSLMCVIYTIIISVMFALGMLLSDSAGLLVPTPSKALLFLLFSAILGFASLILKDSGTGVLRILAHYVLCTVAFILAFVVGGNFPVTGGTSIVAVILFTVFYAVIMIIRAIVCRVKAKKTEKTEEYTSVFN